MTDFRVKDSKHTRFYDCILKCKQDSYYTSRNVLAQFSYFEVIFSKSDDKIVEVESLEKYNDILNDFLNLVYFNTPSSKIDKLILLFDDIGELDYVSDQILELLRTPEANILFFLRGKLSSFSDLDHRKQIVDIALEKHALSEILPILKGYPVLLKYIEPRTREDPVQYLLLKYYLFEKSSPSDLDCEVLTLTSEKYKLHPDIVTTLKEQLEDEVFTAYIVFKFCMYLKSNIGKDESYISYLEEVIASF